MVLFDSIHYVLAAERAFRDRGLWCDLVPTPRQLSSDCGMALEFRREDLDAVRTLLAGGVVKWKSLHEPGDGGYEPVEP